MRRLTQNRKLTKSRLAAVLIAAVSAWASPATADDCIVLEDFAASAADSFPSGWTPREKSGSGVYKVIKDGNTQFVRGHAAGPKSSGNGVEADRPVKWDIEKYPILRWRWRPHVFPRGADEQKGKEDSALGVYIGFCPPEDKDFCERSMRGQLGFGDSLAVARSFMSKGVGSLKYIWSERLPKGLEFERNRKWVKVLESGAPAKPDQWVEERVDVAADYKRRFGAGKLLNPAGLAILTDADDTQSIDAASQAEGDYADFRICRD